MLIECYRVKDRGIFQVGTHTNLSEEGIRISYSTVTKQLETVQLWMQLYPPSNRHEPIIESLDDVIKNCNDIIINTEKDISVVGGYTRSL